MRLFILTLFLSLASVVANAQTYYTGSVVPYSYPPMMPYSAPVVVAPPVYIAPQPILQYQWTPYYYNVPVTTYKHRWFLRREKVVTYQAQMGWVYRPYYTRATTY